MGDEVWVWDEISGEVALKRIQSTLQRQVHALVELVLDGETIYTTPEHPFFVEGNWKEAGLLEIKDQVQLFSSKRARVESIKFTHEYAKAEVLHVNESHELLDVGSVEDVENTIVYNLEVDEFASYFVGWIKALVHNASKTKCVRAGLKKMYNALGKELSCFPAGTLIQNNNGYIEIQNIQTGDYVWAYDLIRNEKVLKQVTETYTNFADTLINITLTNAIQIKATRLHRFWVPEKQAWIKAERLRAGMTVLSNETRIEISDVEVLTTELQPTYNFEVEELHNYFVGECNILVHNADESIFASLDEVFTEIYAIIDTKTNQIIYVGKTEQGIAERFAQHVKEKGLPIERFEPRALAQGHWTPYKTAEMEQHFMNLHDTKIPKLTDKFAHVFNKVNAISEKKFIKYFDLHKLC